MCFQGRGREHVAKLFTLLADDLKKAGRVDEARMALEEYSAVKSRLHTIRSPQH